MGSRVDRLAEDVTCLAQLGERPVCREEVRLGRDQVGLGHPDGRLAAAFGLRVKRHAGDDLEPVVAASGDDLRVPHADPGDPVDRHRPLVVGEGVLRAATEPAERLVEAGDDRGQRPVPGRDDDPEPAPESQAHHRSVSRPPIRGPCPQSNWSHMPGSGIHGRYTRRFVKGAIQPMRTP
jgi:hypothetical protein